MNGLGVDLLLGSALFSSSFFHFYVLAPSHNLHTKVTKSSLRKNFNSVCFWKEGDK